MPDQDLQVPQPVGGSERLALTVDSGRDGSGPAGWNSNLCMCPCSTATFEADEE